MKIMSTGLCIALTVLSAPTMADSGVRSTTVTVLLDLTGQALSYSPAAMEREAGRILESSGVKLAWRVHDHLPFEAEALVVLKFRGSCSLSAHSAYEEESGPLAIT